MENHLVLCTLIFLILTQYMLDADTSRLSVRPNKLVSYSIPQKRPLKKALGFNEDTYLNFTELTTKYGYPTEVHSVTTEDGYILTVFRLLPKCSETVKPDPVLLMHGIFDTSDLWIVSGTQNGLGYVMASNCYDVWVGNTRGNNYSRRHVKLDPNNDPEFWNFTFDEFGNFDVPATIDYVLQATGRSKLFYIGHSQGSTDYFVMVSMRPEYNEKVKLAVQLGPVAWMKNFNHPIGRVAAHNYEAIKAFFDAAGLNEIFARDRIVHVGIEFLCEFAPKVCDFGLTLTTGYKPGTISIKTVPVVIGHLFSGSSIKNLAHFAQLVISGEFQRYNEGTAGNVERYGTPKPPKYNISQISSPVLLISAKGDALSTVKDVEILASKLPNLVENFVVPKSYWSHHNHIWGKTAPQLVYPKILQALDKYSN